MTLYIYTLHSLVSSKFDFTMGPIAVLLVSQPHQKALNHYTLMFFSILCFCMIPVPSPWRITTKLTLQKIFFKDFYRAYI